MSQEPSVCEEKNFREIYTSQSISLRNFLYYKFGNFEKAKDHAQEAFIRLWNNCKQVQFSKARSFLFVTARRLFLDDIAHEKVSLKFREKQNLNPTSEAPDFIMQENEFKKELEQAISNLPEKQRVIFLMNRIDRISYKEIAEINEISVKTVEKHMSAALKNLKSSVSILNKIKI